MKAMAKSQAFLDSDQAGRREFFLKSSEVYTHSFEEDKLVIEIAYRYTRYIVTFVVIMAIAAAIVYVKTARGKGEPKARTMIETGNPEFFSANGDNYYSHQYV